MANINNRVLFVIDDYDYNAYQLLIFKTPGDAAEAENYYVTNFECSDDIENLNLDEKVELITSKFDCDVVDIALDGDLAIEPKHKIYI